MESSKAKFPYYKGASTQIFRLLVIVVLGYTSALATSQANPRGSDKSVLKSRQILRGRVERVYLAILNHNDGDLVEGDVVTDLLLLASEPNVKNILEAVRKRSLPPLAKADTGRAMLAELCLERTLISLLFGDEGHMEPFQMQNNKLCLQIRLRHMGPNITFESQLDGWQKSRKRRNLTPLLRLTRMEYR